MKPLLLEIEPSDRQGFGACVAACAAAERLAEPAWATGRDPETMDSGLEPIRNWLLGREATAPVRLASRASWNARLWMRKGRRSGREAGPFPGGAILLKTGPLGWASPDLHRRLATDPTLVPGAVVEQAWMEAFPEYAPAETVAAWQSGVAAMARLARLAIVPSKDAGRLLARSFARQSGPTPPIVALPAPSRLSGTLALRPDPDLAGIAYLVVAGPIEARTNVLLLLTIWRDLVQAGRPVPKLVLAGRRGVQIEDIKPMLDWNESLRPHVREAADLSPQALAVLIMNAAGLLVPSFAADEAALARDALALGVPVIASDIPVHREVLEARAHLIDPIDGCGWRDAIEALAGRAASTRPQAAQLGDTASTFGERLRATLASL